MTACERDARFGRVTMDGPLEIVAGARVTYAFTYRAGADGLDPGDQVGIAWRLPGDWSTPQFDRPDQSDYVTARAGGAATVELSFDHRGGVKPWNHLLVATLRGAAVPRGERLALVVGDRRAGSVGWGSQTSSVLEHRFVCMLRRAGADTWIRLGDPAPIRVRSGPGEGLVVVAPSQCRVGEPFTYLVRAVDHWGNPSAGHTGPIEVTGEGVEMLSLRREARHGETYDLWTGTARVDVAREHLVLRAAAPSAGWVAESNPMSCHAVRPRLQPYWGDLHAGQCDLGCGQGSLDDHFWYARSVAGLQFASHQANDVYVTQSDWAVTRQVTERHYEPGAFVTILGCEWTALPPSGGDRNVFYRHDREVLHRAGRWFEDDVAEEWPDAPDPPALYARLETGGALINLHAGGFTSNLDFHHPEIERLVEIHSTHGTSDWLVEEALERGYRVAVTAGTDGIAGRPGACRPGRRQTRNVAGGALAVVATDLSREALWRALVARRCYGTNGPRIVLDLDADGRTMGAAYETSESPRFRLRVLGTAAIDRVLLRRGRSTIEERQLALTDDPSGSTLRLLWRGTRRQGTARDQRLIWDGGLRASMGRLEHLRSLGFEHGDAVEATDLGTLRWRSSTAGGFAGVVVRCDGPGDARMEFTSAPTTFSFTRDEVARGPKRVAIDGARGAVSVALAPSEDAACTCALTFSDDVHVPGTHAYWFEVVQVDGGRAWTSPCFVTRR